MSKQNKLSIQAISERIVDAVLEDKLIDKDKLIHRVKMLVNIWVQRTYLTEDLNKMQELALVDRLQNSCYRKILKDKIGKEEMKILYENNLGDLITMIEPNQRLIDYIYEFAAIYGEYYHAKDFDAIMENVSQKIDTPEEFTKKLGY